MWLNFLVVFTFGSTVVLDDGKKGVEAGVNNQPVIGILTLPNYPYENFTVNGTSYMASSYVKYLEMSGARVVPIRIDHSFSEIDYLFTRLNGILFTGGTANFWVNNSVTPVLSPDYAAKACYIFNKVIQINDQGQFYPLWGTCMGFEVLHVCANQQFGTIGNFNGKPPYTRSSEFLPAASSSVIFNTLNPEWSKRVMDIMSTMNVSLLNHYRGISPQAYAQYPSLGNMFKVLSYMKDKSGSTFVGMVEGVKYPIYGTQFHPEKNIFEWNDAVFPHFYEAVEMTRFLSNFFVTQARKNPNVFPSNELTPALIYNWPPIFINSYFETISAFN
jgi:gamma-glutamyl hydrolase